MSVNAIDRYEELVRAAEQFADALEKIGVTAEIDFGRDTNAGKMLRAELNQLAIEQCLGTYPSDGTTARLSNALNRISGQR